MRGISSSAVFGAWLSCVLGACAGNDATCPDGACAPEATCDGGACADSATPRPPPGCEPSRVCAAECCEGQEICSIGQCVLAEGDCVDDSDCAATSFCDFGLKGPAAEFTCATATDYRGSCVPRPRACTEGGIPGETCLELCDVRPDTVTFALEPRYSWPPSVEQPAAPYANDIMMTPVVIELDDDNCDGRVNRRDNPDIVATTFAGGGYHNSGTMRAFTIADGQLREKWSVPNVLGVAQIAAGDFHPSFGSEVVGYDTEGRLVAVSATGSVLWRSQPTVMTAPSLADLDQDGDVEIIDTGGIFDGATGALEHTYAVPASGMVVASDIDGNGVLDVVGANGAYRADGTVLVDVRSIFGLGGEGNPLAVVVDLDGEGTPEVVFTIPGTNQVGAWRYSATAPGNFEIVRAPFSAAVDPGGEWEWSRGMGTITAADFDADGHPDIAYAGFRGYVVLSGVKLADAARPSTLDQAGVLLWAIPTAEDNGSTGSAAFDFNGDGQVEVLYNDTQRLHILNGATGVELGSMCNTSGTSWEYPVVADVDANGEADVVIVANAFSNRDSLSESISPSYRCEGTWQSGLRVVSSRDGSWVRAPKIWNQHAYHVTNVNEDGVIPRVEPSNIADRGLNNYRQNRQPGAEYAAPDAAISLQCAGNESLRVVIRNLGTATLPAGTVAIVSNEAGAEIARTSTTRSLAAAQSETLEVAWDGSPRPTASLVLDPRVGDCRNDNDRAAMQCLE